jgi:hypothetical protein
VCALAVAALAFSWARDADAAGARIVWARQEDAESYRLYVAQPDADNPLVFDAKIENPGVGDDGNYFYEVDGIDPLRPAFFLMVAINWQGLASDGSNILELGDGSFCDAFDVDGDGRVSTVDALIIARKALGLGQDDSAVEGSIVTALEILRLAASGGCN